MNRKVFLISLIAALGGLLFGYDTAVIAGAIGFLRDKFLLDAAEMGWAASSALVGCIIGCSVAGVTSDGIGRKRTLLITAILFFISAIGSAVAGNLSEFVFYRMIGGVAVGAASMLSPLYIAEVTPAAIRGRMVSLNQLAITLGMLVVYFVNYIISLQGNQTWNIESGWRWMFASEALPAFVFFIFLLWIPESPRWLLKQKKDEQALDILKLVDPQMAVQEVAAIKTLIALEKSSWRLLFARGVRLLLLLGISLAVLQQITGINVFLYYAPEIFKKLGTGSDTALLQTIVIGAVNMGFTLIAIKKVDKWGRKPLMLIGASGMGICLFGMGLTAYFQQTAGWVLLFVLGYIACFALSVGPVTWVILSEIFPTVIRGVAMSVATISLWAANWLVSQTFPMMDENEWLVSHFHHGFTFWVYGFMCLILILVVQKFVPETKGKTLEEIEGALISRL
jgi:MFS transporter, SP family, xylose:H+ symportor